MQDIIKVTRAATGKPVFVFVQHIVTVADAFQREDGDTAKAVIELSTQLEDQPDFERGTEEPRKVIALVRGEQPTVAP